LRRTRVLPVFRDANRRKSAARAPALKLAFGADSVL
jgi:hypothetical protein